MKEGKSIVKKLEESGTFVEGRVLSTAIRVLDIEKKKRLEGLIFGDKLL